MLDRAIIVLVLGIVAQSLLRWAGPRAGGAWREDLAAEVRLAEALLEGQPSAVSAEGSVAGRTDPLLAGAVGNLQRRLELVRAGLAEHDTGTWLHRFFVDAPSLQAHTAWLRQWRQEWAERLTSPPPRGAVGGRSDAPLAAAPALEAEEGGLDGGGRPGESGTCSLGDGAAACPAAAAPAATAERRRGSPTAARAEVPATAPEPPSSEDAVEEGAAGLGAGGDSLPDPDEGDFEAMKPVLQEVLEMMRQEPKNRVMQERGCETLRYLAVDETSRVAIAAKDGIQAVLRAMRENAGAADVQGYCCGTLTHLAATPRNRVRILSLKGIQAVLKAMRAHLGSSLVQYKGCAALANLAVSEVEQAKVSRLGGAKAALRAMDVHLQDTAVLEHCLGALHNLASLADNRPNITAAGADMSLQKVMSKNKGSAEVQRLGRKLQKLLKA